VAGYRHGEELLLRLEALLRDRGLAPGDLGGLVVGTGPGAFTGLRVGLATAKGLGHALGLALVGVPTSGALIEAAARAMAGPTADRATAGADPAATAHIVLLQPAGPTDRVVSRAGEPSRILPGGTDPVPYPGDVLVAVDLEGRAPEDAVARGEAARDGLAPALLAAGARRLAAGDPDDLARLVPEYVTLPRGVHTVPARDGVAVSGGTGRA
jgi:tRNA threonylcarbamoyl adenosine modification protein YeaZ